MIIFLSVLWRTYQNIELSMAYIAKEEGSQYIKVINIETKESRVIGNFSSGYTSFYVSGDYLVVTLPEGTTVMYDCRTGDHYRTL